MAKQRPRKAADGPEAEQLQVLPPEQVFLFENYEEQPVLVEKCKEFIHKGGRLLADPERTRDVIEAILNGASFRAVAKQYHVGRQTLTTVYTMLEQANLLEPFAKRLSRDWQETAQLAQWRIQEALMAGEMPLQVLPALAGIATDKIGQLTHFDAGGERAKERNITPEAAARAMEAARRAAMEESTVDGESTGDARKLLMANGGAVADTVLDTGAGAETGAETTAAEADERAVEGVQVGGGDRDFAGGADGRGEGTGKF